MTESFMIREFEVTIEPNLCEQYGARYYLYIVDTVDYLEVLNGVSFPSLERAIDYAYDFLEGVKRK